MAKKNIPSASQKSFLFDKKNYLFMGIGIALIVLGFLLMTGADANTVDGVSSPDNWNSGIFSWRRIRLAPFLIILGFAIQVYAILLNPNDNNSSIKK